MSDILNHYRCGKQVFNALPEDNVFTEPVQRRYDAYRIGTQGPDFLYYNILDGVNTKKAVDAAHAIHESHTDAFFTAALCWADEHPKYKDTALAYIAGFVTHQQLDAATHPLIFNKTGCPKTADAKTQRRASYLHKKYEMLLDTAMTQYEYGTQAVFDYAEKVFTVTPDTLRFLNKFYADLLPEVYGLSLPPGVLRRSLYKAANIIHLSKDPYGRRTKLLRPIERLVGEEDALSRMFYPMYTNEYRVLNLGHKPWRDPVTGETRNESYPQLFHSAVDNSLKTLYTLSNLFKKRDFTNSDISALFKDVSYLSGRPCSSKESFNYFDPYFV